MIMCICMYTCEPAVPILHIDLLTQRVIQHRTPKAAIAFRGSDRNSIWIIRTNRDSMRSVCFTDQRAAHTYIRNIMQF